MTLLALVDALRERMGSGIRLSVVKLSRSTALLVLQKSKMAIGS
jgi:hypothetical protein